MRNLFRLKSKNPYPAGVLCEGICSCKENYNRETKRNIEIRWYEHSGINKESEPSRNLNRNPTHVFRWKVVMATPINDCVRKNLL